ncbi:Ribose import permease protein RbsC [compost metagenome]
MSADTKIIGAPTPMKALHSPGEFGWIWVALIILALATGLIAPSALKLESLYSMLPFASVLGLVAVGQTLIIQQRGLDMSAAAIVTIGGLSAAKLSALTGSAAVGVALTMFICGAAGALNGTLVAKLGISPIVATLATASLYTGVARLLADGSAMPVDLPIQYFAQARLFGIPALTYAALLMVLMTHLGLKKSVVGRRFVAVGANPATAEAQGTLVGFYQVGSYAAAGICYAVAGIALAGFVGYASSTAGMGYLLPSIAAVVVGGTPFTGGRGSVIATGGAVAFMTLLDQLVLSMGAGAAVQLLAQAMALVIAVSIRRLPSIGRR